MTTVRGACNGIHVLEIGSGSVAASLAGMVLADNGARVVKIEPPEGDAARRHSPAGFLVWNRGKQSLVHDLRQEAGRASVRSLARAVDVVLVGLDPWTVGEWGLDDVTLRAEHPELVYTAITGFGPSGPYARLKAYEGVVAAKVGLYGRGIFASRDGPVFSPNLIASSGAAHLAVSGTLAALMAREVTGRGQRVDTSLVQGLIAADYFGIYHAQLAHRAEGSDAAPATAPGEGLTASRYAMTLCTGDGHWVSLSPQQPHQAHALLRALRLEATLADARFAHAPYFRTAEDAQAWEDLVSETFRAQSYAEIETALLGEADVPFERCRSSAEALAHPQILANGEVVELDDPYVGPIRQIGPVAMLARTPADIRTPAPALGSGTPPPGRAVPIRPSVRAGRLDHALSGVTIVEFGYFYAMPYAMTIAAALGARVIKLEDAAGDPIRHAFGGDAGCAKVMEGKQSFAVDLKSERGCALVQELVASADAFALGFRPGVAERLGIDYPTLAARNPRLVYLHAAGYGVTGPYAHRPVYANTAMALSGSVARHAGAWMDHDLSDGLSVVELQAIVTPHLRGLVDGDSNASLASCTALMLALHHQRRTGEGQFVATSMIGGNLYAYTDDAIEYEGRPTLARADPDHDGLGALYRLYRVADGWVFLAAPRPADWHSLTAVLGLEHLRDDPRFASPEARRTNDRELSPVIATALANRCGHEVEASLAALAVGCAVASEAEYRMGSHPAFVAEDPVMRETGMSVDIEHPRFGVIRRHGLPVHFSETPGRIAASCARGEHTLEILAELGCSEREIAQLQADEIVFGP